MKLIILLKKLLLLLILTSCNFSHSGIPNISKNHPILGKWKVGEVGIAPFDLDSFCGGLTKGSIIEFNIDNDILIFKEGKYPCNKEQKYWIDSLNKLIIFEYDVGIGLTIEYLEIDSMKLSSDRFWPPIDNEQIIVDSSLLEGLNEMGNRLVLKKLKTDN